MALADPTPLSAADQLTRYGVFLISFAVSILIFQVTLRIKTQFAIDQIPPSPTVKKLHYAKNRFG
jgi:hypothetical protein